MNFLSIDKAATFAHVPKSTACIAKYINTTKELKRLTEKVLLNTRDSSTNNRTLPHGYALEESLIDTYL
jgi:hypothetical protein